MRLGPIGKLYLTEFLLNGITFGVGMEFLSLLWGDGFSIITLLFSTIFFGVVMSFFYVSNVEEFIQDLNFDIMSRSKMKGYEQVLIQTTDSEDKIIHKLSNNDIINELKIAKCPEGIIIKSKHFWSERMKSILISKQENNNYMIAPKSRFIFKTWNYYKTVYLIRYIKEKILYQQ